MKTENKGRGKRFFLGALSGFLAALALLAAAWYFRLVNIPALGALRSSKASAATANADSSGARSDTASGLARNAVRATTGARSASGSASGAASNSAGGSEALRIVAAESLNEEPLIETTGNLEPARAVDLTFSAAGRVTGISVKAGDLVETGQELASLDDREARYKLADASKRLLQATIAGNESDAALLALEKDLRQADLDATVLRAPFTGVVSSVDIEKGGTVGSSTKALRLLDRSSLMAVLEIDEIDLPLIKTGQKVAFTFDALPGKSYEGRITLIPQEGTVTNQGLAVFEVEATIASPPPELKPGYSFVAKVSAAEPKTLVVVPSAAIVESDGIQTVLVVGAQGAKPESRVVTARKRDDGKAEISQGLAVGERVVVQDAAAAENARQGGFNFMLPGMGGSPPGANQGGSRNTGGSGTRR